LALLFSFALSAASRAELVDNGNGTVTDTVTGLIWLQDANWPLTSGYDPNGLTDRYAFSKWAGTLGYAGYDDWRLPNTDDTCTGNHCTESELGSCTMNRWVTDRPTVDQHGSFFQPAVQLLLDE